MPSLNPDELERLPYGALVKLILPTGEVQRYAKVTDPRFGTLWVLTSNATSKLAPQTMKSFAAAGMVGMPDLHPMVIPLDDPLSAKGLQSTEERPGSYGYVRKPKKR